MKRKAIFGGTFDPIHNGHLHIAYEALNFLNLDKLIFMPSGNPPHKLKLDKTDAFIRCELIRMAIRGEKLFEVSDYEINRKEINYTYKTLEHFSSLEPDTEWYFITGVDCLMELDSWRNVERILNSSRFVVFNRPGYEKDEILKQKIRVEKLYNKEIIFMDLPLLDISSSVIKKKIQKGNNVSYLMPQGVYNTVLELGLYKQEGISVNVEWRTNWGVFKE